MHRGRAMRLKPMLVPHCRPLSRRMKKSLRHCYGSLKRDGHAFEFVVMDGFAKCEDVNPETSVI